MSLATTKAIPERGRPGFKPVTMRVRGTICSPRCVPNEPSQPPNLEEEEEAEEAEGEEDEFKNTKKRLLQY